MILKTNVIEMRGTRGRMIPLERCLVDPFRNPRGGWKVNFVIKGIGTEISGMGSRDVYNKCRKILNRNGVSLSDKDLWFSLNYQWCQRIDQGGFLVPQSEFLALAGKTEQVDNKVKNKTYSHPAEWGSVGWRMMAHHLAKDEKYYDWRKFVVVMEEVLDWLNPNVTPTMGCIECYNEFFKQYSIFKNSPIVKRDDAREWLVSVHNLVNKKIGKPQVDIVAATKANNW